MNTSEILDRAADLIEQRGHFKGWYCGPDGSLCPRGAMYAACGVEPQPTETHDTVERWPGWTVERDRQVDAATAVLDARLPRLTEYWNDADERTAAEVVTALREAARAER